MRFGEMLELIRDGKHRATRKGWHGKGMYIYVEQGKVIPWQNLRVPQDRWLAGGDMIVAPHFNLFVDGVVVVGWLASQTDMLADDWEILEEEGEGD